MKVDMTYSLPCAQAVLDSPIEALSLEAGHEKFCDLASEQEETARLILTQSPQPLNVPPWHYEGVTR
jgi:hypothetical protein